MLLLFGCTQKPQPIADNRMNDYALYDEQGNFHRFSYYNNSKGLVLFVQGNGCPIVRLALQDFKAVKEAYSEKGFQFFMVNSNLQDHRESIHQEALDYDFGVPVLDDSAQILAQALNITITAEAIVLHPITREILYRGPLNNQLDYETSRPEATIHYLQNALDAILKGSIPPSQHDLVKGCKVTRWTTLGFNKDTITYTKDVAPILQQHCVRCHHDGGIAPWSMSDYHTITGWSQMMKQVLITKRMPPWKADPYIGTFKNDFSLPDSSLRKLYQWIETGTPYGAGPDPMASLHFDDKEWKRGTPDTIIILNKEQIPSQGVIPYRYQKIDLKLPRDTWIEGLEIQPGNAKVMHHILINNKTPGSPIPILDRKPRKWIDNFIALGGMGDQPIRYPDSTGVLLKKDSQLIVQIHYTPTGKPEEDQTRIGLYYSKAVPKKVMHSFATANLDFTIPPFGQNIHLIARDTLTKPIKLHYMVPHMHYRGKSIQVRALFPDGNTQTLVSVPDYNFNWQRLYVPEPPIALPKGTIVEVEGIYDNSFQNPFNPDPERELHYGIQSTDEMLIGFFNYTFDEN
ncbi:MAG: redoxin domain-containing protein [Flavobacteriaceae bacterium]